MGQYVLYQFEPGATFQFKNLDGEIVEATVTNVRIFADSDGDASSYVTYEWGDRVGIRSAITLATCLIKLGARQVNCPEV